MKVFVLTPSEMRSLRHRKVSYAPASDLRRVIRHMTEKKQKIRTWEIIGIQRHELVSFLREYIRHKSIIRARDSFRRRWRNKQLARNAVDRAKILGSFKRWVLEVPSVAINIAAQLSTNELKTTTICQRTSDVSGHCAICDVARRRPWAAKYSEELSTAEGACDMKGERFVIWAAIVSPSRIIRKDKSHDVHHWEESGMLHRAI